MEEFNFSEAIEDFMHPTVYTGVKPLFLIAEELPTAFKLGQVVEAVWLNINSTTEFHYISKFAVSGKIILKKYYEPDEMEPFYGRVALINDANLENAMLHRNTLANIDELELKRFALLDEIEKEFDNLLDLYVEGNELYLFKNKDEEYDEELFSALDINTPYKVVHVEKKSTGVEVILHNSKTDKTKTYLNTDDFYGYFVGSQAEISGLKLKNASYLESIKSLKNDTKKIIKKIEWLELDDSHIKEISQALPKHPFEEYFHYVKKEDVRHVDVSDELVETLKKIILKHMPENDTPLGMEYIAIDKLLYLFHMIIPRDEALSALEMCDIVYEPPGVLLGYGGDRKLPPKYLVPITHVASAYQRFPSFMSVCKNITED